MFMGLSVALGFFAISFVVLLWLFSAPLLFPCVLHLGFPFGSHKA